MELLKYYKDEFDRDMGEANKLVAQISLTGEPSKNAEHKIQDAERNLGHFENTLSSES